MRLLAIDSASGKLILTKTPTTFEYNAYWLVRYAGREHGRGKYTIQNLGHSQGGHDMSFIAADAQSGAIGLTRDVTPGAFWTMNRVEMAPRELIR